MSHHVIDTMEFFCGTLLETKSVVGTSQVCVLIDYLSNIFCKIMVGVSCERNGAPLILIEALHFLLIIITHHQHITHLYMPWFWGFGALSWISMSI